MLSTLARSHWHLAGSAAHQCILTRKPLPSLIHASPRNTRLCASAPPTGSPAYSVAPQYNQYQDTTNYPPSGDYQAPAYGATDRSDRRYIAWNVYKAKSALAVKLIRPKYAQNPDGSFRIDREGELRLEFTMALQGGPQEGESPNRKFDWANKQVIHLSAVELATLVEDVNSPHQFYHDPKKGTPEENTIGKNLKWNPPSNASDPKANWYMNLTVTNRADNRPLNYSIGLSKGELGVLKNLAPNLIWHMLGFSEVPIS